MGRMLHKLNYLSHYYRNKFYFDADGFGQEGRRGRLQIIAEKDAGDGETGSSI